MAEGWGVMRPGDRVYHYYRDQMSLCGRVGFYRGELTPDIGDPQQQDCASCTRKLGREKLTARRIAPGHYVMGDYTLKRQRDAQFDSDWYWAVGQTSALPDEPVLVRIDGQARLYWAATLNRVKNWVLNQAAKG